MGKWLRLGGLELLVVSDGVLKLDAGGIFGITPRAVWEPLVEPLDDQHRLQLGLNCLLIPRSGQDHPNGDLLRHQADAFGRRGLRGIRQAVE